MYGDIPEEYYAAAANMIWDFGEGIDELFVDHPDAISPALGLIENSDEDRLAKLLWNLKILEPPAGPDMMGENTMRLSKRQLIRIIREEKRRLQELGHPSDAMIRARNEEPDPMEAMRSRSPEERSERAMSALTDAIDRCMDAVGEDACMQFLRAFCDNY